MTKKTEFATDTKDLQSMRERESYFRNNNGGAESAWAHKEGHMFYSLGARKDIRKKNKKVDKWINCI